MARGTKARGIAGKRDVTPAVLGSLPTNIVVVTGPTDGDFNVTFDEAPDTDYGGAAMGMGYVAGGAGLTDPSVIVPYTSGTNVASGFAAGAAVDVYMARQDLFSGKGSGAWGTIVGPYSGVVGTT